VGNHNGSSLVELRVYWLNENSTFTVVDNSLMDFFEEPASSFQIQILPLANNTSWEEDAPTYHTLVAAFIGGPSE